MPETSINLARSALLIAAEEEPNLDVARYLGRIDEMGHQARWRLSHSDREPISAFNDFMFQEIGFGGNRDNYYDPRNSFLSYVIDRHSGIPITLSVVYMEVGRRAGLEVEGVGLPGHFIVRARVPGQARQDSVATLVDPYEGTTLDESDCQERLNEVYNGSVALAEEHLRAATNREILVRMLTNLKIIYTRAKLHRQALAAVERILLVTPEAVAERRDRGMLLGELGRLPEAMEATRSYLQRVPAAEDAAVVQEHLNVLMRQQALQN